MRKLILASFLLIPLTLAAEVSHTFTAGTPAKAVEVNNNFDSLESRLSTLENSHNEADPITPRHTITYRYSASAAGDRISIGSSNYRLVKVAVKEFSSGDVYHITYPVYAWGSPDVDEKLTAYMTTHHSPVPETINATISGYPAYLSIEGSRYFYASKDEAGRDLYNKISSGYVARGVVWVQIADTSFRIRIQQEGEGFRQVTEGFDFAANVDTDLMGHNMDFIQQVDDLIDYIAILKVASP